MTPYSPLLRLAPFVVLSLLAASCAKEKAPEVISAPRVVTAEVVGVDLDEQIEVTGELQARLRTFVAARVSGEITQLLADEGATVTAGTPVLEIDPQRRRLELDAARAAVAQAEASLNQARRQADRVLKLQRGGVASTSQLDEADLSRQLSEARLAADRARFELTAQALEDATVRAPFGGVIGLRRANLGELVQIGQPLIEFVSLDPLDVVFHVAEVDSAVVKKGQRVQLSVAPYPGERFQATVEVIYPAMETQSRTLRVKARVENAQGRLRPGLFTHADLGIAVRKAVPMVPEESILQRADGPVVFVLADGGADGGRVQRRNVELGLYQDRLVEIRKGVRAGESVVVRGHTDLIDGAVVEVVGATAADGGAAAEAAAGAGT